MRHLTLNTGHLRASPRSEVGQAVIDSLLPVLDAEGGPIPGLDGWYLDLMRPVLPDGALRDGAAFFQVADEPGTSKRPVAMAVCCWQEQMSAEAWEQATHAYGALRSVLTRVGLWRSPPPKPPQVPWLAVWITPMAVLADSQVIQAIGDLERCVAWALMEGSSGDQR